MTKENPDTGRRLAALEEIDVESLRALKKRRAEIIAGDLPALEEILIHAVWCSGSMISDRIRFFTSVLHGRILSDAEREIIEQAISDGSALVLELCREIFDIRGRFSDVARCDLYIACSDTERDGYDHEVAEMAAKRLFHDRQSTLLDSRFGATLRHATALGLLNSPRAFERRIDRAQRYGMQRLLDNGRDVDAYRQAYVWLAEHPEALDEIKDDSKKSLFEKLREVEEDRAEIEPDLDFDLPGVVVVPALPKGVGGKRIRARYSPTSPAGSCRLSIAGPSTCISMSSCRSGRMPATSSTASFSISRLMSACGFVRCALSASRGLGRPPFCVRSRPS
ncbi:hypothetical protein [Pelagibacterium sp.]|uniref:hypothetical protein n=1 Tax=Pelagibacterium sp. TaxID=1967288 RepID=UPI003BAB81FB